MRDHLVLYVNGVRHRLGYDDAVMNLADFLRRRLSLVGTKVVCNEGDCGACSVLVGRPHADFSRLDYRTIDACIAFLFQLDQAHIVTVEGLNAGDDALTPIQDAMVRCHGSQCGFCTPGFVVAMHGIVEQDLPCDDDHLRYGLSGNLCRCTGYSQILDAGKSLDSSSVARLSQRYPEPTMIADLRRSAHDAVELQGTYRVMIPRTLDQATRYRAACPDAVIVSGATDYGVLHNHGRIPPSDVLCLSAVKDYQRVAVDDGWLRIGGGATWTQIEPFVERHFPPYHEIVTRFGSPQIRNAGTLAGNLAGGSPIADAAPFHLVMESRLDLVGVEGTRSVSLNDFYRGYRKTAIAADELIAAIHTPLLSENQRLVLYKISKRRDMDISTLTLALWIQLDGQRIMDARLALGGVGPTVLRISAVEQHLAGKTLTLSTMHQAGEIARAEISPWSDVRGGADFRLQLTENLMTKAYYELTNPMVVA